MGSSDLIRVCALMACVLAATSMRVAPGNTARVDSPGEGQQQLRYTSEAETDRVTSLPGLASQPAFNMFSG
jgi:hypothetical protein